LLQHGVDLSPSFLSLKKLRDLSKSNVGTQMASFLDQNKEKQQVLLSPYELAVLMGHEQSLERWSNDAVNTYIVKRGSEYSTKNQGYLPKSILAYFKKTEGLKAQKEAVELKFKAAETLINALKNNDERVIGRKYYLDLINDYYAEYMKVLSQIPDNKKEKLLQNEEQLRNPGLSSAVLHGMSWATSLFSVGYRSLTPPSQQEYMKSILPQTLDGECKVILKQLIHEYRDSFKNELTILEQKTQQLNKKTFNKNTEIIPHLSILSAQKIGVFSSVVQTIDATCTQKKTAEQLGFFKAGSGNLKQANFGLKAGLN
jgi:hypothetical protein